jgi:hypothetical protein
MIIGWLGDYICALQGSTLSSKLMDTHTHTESLQLPVQTGKLSPRSWTMRGWSRARPRGLTPYPKERGGV